MLVPSPSDKKIWWAQDFTKKYESVSMELYDLISIPTNEDTWHTYVVRQDGQDFESFPWNFPSIHVVGFLSDRSCVVAVASCIQQQFKNAYEQYLSDEVPAGEDIFLDVLNPPADEKAKLGMATAREKTRSSVLRRAVKGVTCPGGLALYQYYKKIINCIWDLLPIEWALLGYDLRSSEPEIRDRFILSSIFLELHFLQDLNSDAVSQLLERKQQVGWGEYLATKESLAITKVIENPNDEMHEILLVRGLLELAGHQTRVCYYQYDQERTIDNSCLILGRVLRCVFYPEDKTKSENRSKPPGRMRIPSPLGAHDVRERLTRSGYSDTHISEWCANLTIFLPIGVPVPYRETLPATLVNRLRRGVVMDAIREISDTYMLHLRKLEMKENDTMLFLLYLVNKGLESKVTSKWMTSTEGQSMYDQTLTRMREQVQSLEQFTLSLYTLLAYSYLLDSPVQALEPVYECNLRDFSYLLHGNKQVNRRGVLEIVASYAQKALNSLSVGVAQTVMPTIRPSSVHWCDGYVERYCQHRSTGGMTHDEAYRKTCHSIATNLSFLLQHVKIES